MRQVSRSPRRVRDCVVGPYPVRLSPVSTGKTRVDVVHSLWFNPEKRIQEKEELSGRRKGVLGEKGRNQTPGVVRSSRTLQKDSTVTILCPSFQTVSKTMRLSCKGVRPPRGRRPGEEGRKGSSRTVGHETDEGLVRFLRGPSTIVQLPVTLSFGS